MSADRRDVSPPALQAVSRTFTALRAALGPRREAPALLDELSRLVDACMTMTVLRGILASDDAPESLHLVRIGAFSKCLAQSERHILMSSGVVNPGSADGQRVSVGDGGIDRLRHDRVAVAARLGQREEVVR